MKKIIKHIIMVRMGDERAGEFDKKFGKGAANHLKKMQDAELVALNQLNPDEREVVTLYDEVKDAEMAARRATGQPVTDDDLEAARQTAFARVPAARTVMPKFVDLADKVIEEGRKK